MWRDYHEAFEANTSADFLSRNLIIPYIVELDFNVKGRLF